MPYTNAFNSIVEKLYYIRPGVTLTQRANSTQYYK